EFSRLPSEGSTRYEVIDGELAVTPAPSLRHQRIVMDLGTLLNTFVRDHGLGEVYPGPVDVLFAEGDYFEPDLVFVRKDRLGLLSDRGIEGPPDLVIEIISPATAHRDRGVKLDRYRHFGVAEYWVVDPEAASIEVWAMAAGEEEPVVIGPTDTLHWRPSGEPTLEIRLAELFAGS
ncbi:MAG TPA: Uma2 family endonuclease, partial [Thermoanaerobaculia bacterium]|nr:Uma2 family endonuclease [Thermoanaerobaculia bacterium]